MYVSHLTPAMFSNQYPCSKQNKERQTWISHFAINILTQQFNSAYDKPKDVFEWRRPALGARERACVFVGGLTHQRVSSWSTRWHCPRYGWPALWTCSQRCRPLCSLRELHVHRGHRRTGEKELGSSRLRQGKLLRQLALLKCKRLTAARWLAAVEPIAWFTVDHRFLLFKLKVSCHLTNENVLIISAEQHWSFSWWRNCQKMADYSCDMHNYALLSEWIWLAPAECAESIWCCLTLWNATRRCKYFDVKPEIVSRFQDVLVSPSRSVLYKKIFKSQTVVPLSSVLLNA